MEKSHRVLVVDDAPANIKVLVSLLRETYHISVATNGEDGLALAGESPPPDCILLDILMPGMDGYEVCRRLKNNPLTAKIPVLFVTSLDDTEDETRGFESGAVDYITKPIQPATVLARVATHIQLYEYQHHLEALVRERTCQLAATQDAAILSLATLAECRDVDTGHHLHRTREYVRVLAHYLFGLGSFPDVLRDQGTVEMLYKSAPLHDIGKVGIRDAVLLKPSSFTDEEYEAMKQHTVLGMEAIRAAEETLGPDSFLQFAGEIAWCHHECWDGTGYPRGLAGEVIPLAARMMAVADVYDALVMPRIYKEPMVHTEAVKHIVSGRATKFDPLMVDAFLACEEEFRTIARTNMPGREG